MKFVEALALASLVLFPSTSLFAQDAVKTDPAHYKVLFENTGVRILKISYAPGEKSIMHSHPDTVVIPLATSHVRFTTPDGKSEDQRLANESAMYAPAGTHNPANVGPGPVDAILVEFKSAAPGKATIPSSRDDMGMKLLAEHPRGMVYRVTAQPTFQEPAGTKHDYDQVVIALASSPMSLALDGGPARTSWTRGDVQFVGRGVGHESRNTGGKPTDFILVFIR